ncbi:MAG: NnrU family protein, partial [Gammaproteobacteria bacterium]|nr:NnrU family protein [Gammaproteobacteria bacterium]
MIKLVLGVLLWSITHLIPAVAADFRKNLVSRIGENPYKGVFTLLMVLSIYLIVSGWRSVVPELVYVPPTWGRHATALLVLAGFILFLAPYPPNNLKRLLRHPQLT